MYGTQTFLKGGRSHGGCTHHMRTCLYVIAFGIGTRQVFVNQTHPFERYALTHRVIVR